MDGFEKLKETLLQSAQGEAEALLATATVNVAVIGKENADEIWLLKERAAKELEQLAEADQRRDNALANLDKRRAELNARQSLLDEVMADTLNALVDLPNETKRNYYEKLLKANAEGTTSILCAAADLEGVQTLLREMNLEQSCQSDEKMRGGLIFQSDRFWIDQSFESSLYNRRDEFVELAAKILFNVGEEA